MDKWMKEFKAKYNDDFYTGSTIRIFETLGAAMAKAKSTDPVKVAAALEGLKVKSFNGEVEMRKTDHQLQQPLYMTVWQKADEVPLQPREHRHDLVPLKEYPNYVSSTPTSCQMKRPLIRQRGAAGARTGAPYRAPLFLIGEEGRRRHGVFHHLDAQRPELRAAAVHAQLGPDADLQHDGRAELRACQFLHAGRLRGLQHLVVSPASGRRWCWRRWWWARWAPCSSAWPAAGAQVRPCARAADHLRPVVCALSNWCSSSGAAWRWNSIRPRCCKARRSP
jgi:hypothetical protein